MDIIPDHKGGQAGEYAEYQKQGRPEPSQGPDRPGWGNGHLLRCQQGQGPEAEGDQHQEIIFAQGQVYTEEQSGPVE